jgi:hypothetical protein
MRITMTRHKPVKTPLGVFSSVKEAAKAHDCGATVISKRCKNTEGYEYLPKNQ